MFQSRNTASLQVFLSREQPHKGAYDQVMDPFLQQKHDIMGLEVRADAILGQVVTVRFEDRYLICVGVEALHLLASPLHLPVHAMLLIYPQHYDDPDEILYTVKDNQEKFISLHCQSYEIIEAVY